MFREIAYHDIRQYTNTMITSDVSVIREAHRQFTKEEMKDYICKNIWLEYTMVHLYAYK